MRRVSIPSIASRVLASVPVVDDQTGSHGGKLVEGMLQILHGLKIIQMIVVDVEDYGDVR